MLIVQKRIPPQPAFDAELALALEHCQKSRLRATVTGGEEIGLLLERGAVLRGGEFLPADVGAAPQPAGALALSPLVRLLQLASPAPPIGA